MGLRDRFYTPQTAKAILSWRILLGAAVGVGMALAGIPVVVSVVVAAAVYAASVLSAMPREMHRSRIDPFTLSEPWRQFVQGAQRADRNLRETVGRVSEGPLKDRLSAIVDKLTHGIDEAWIIAKRGDEIDHALRRIDPTALRSKLATLRQQEARQTSADVESAIASVESQLASADRLKEQSAQTAGKLRLTQTRLDELVARAAEVSVGSGDTDAYQHDVDDLVIELESLRLAVEETRSS